MGLTGLPATDFSLDCGLGLGLALLVGEQHTTSASLKSMQKDGDAGAPELFGVLFGVLLGVLLPRSLGVAVRDVFGVVLPRSLGVAAAVGRRSDLEVTAMAYTSCCGGARCCADWGDLLYSSLS